MKKIIIISILMTTWGSLFSQVNCDIKAHYGDFIKIKRETYNDHEYLLKQAVEAPSASCVAPVVKNIAYIDYLLTNFSAGGNFTELDSIRDSVVLQNKFIVMLQQDTMFGRVMTELFSKTIGKTAQKDSVTMDKMLDIAVKYFSIIRVTDAGYYAGKVCAGLNQIEATEYFRIPQVEAFCFSSILKNYNGEKYRMNDEFTKSIKELYKVNLGTDFAERLLRAQGAMYMLMRNNANLRKMLISEYEMNKDVLPFILIK